MRQKIAIVIYANPDYYPPVINAIEILSKIFDLIVICRNQDKTLHIYPDNVKIFRLGKLDTVYQKQKQPIISKIKEYIIFILKTVFLIYKYNCKLIYSYDQHALIASFFTGRFIKRIPIIYHNLDLIALKEVKGYPYLMKYLELKISYFIDKIILCDINRARFFKKEAGLKDLPEVIMNTPLRKDILPKNKLKDILEKRRFGSDVKVILYQGSIGNGKALLEVLKSMTLWPEDTVLVLLGYLYRDFAKDFFKEAYRINLNRRIVYIPAVAYKDLFNYTVGAYLGLGLYVSYDRLNWIFVAGASNKIFEYISMGVPPIVPDTVYFKEVFSESLVYFANPFSYKDIAKAVNTAITDYRSYLNKSLNCRRAHLEKINYQYEFRKTLEWITKKLKDKK